MGQLDGKVAIITGAARGQGAAEAKLFAAEGAKVVITDILAEEGAATAAEIGPSALFIHHDVSSEEGWNDVVEKTLAAFGRIDILINNAAISRAFKLEDTDPELYDLIYRINQRGVYLGMRAVLPTMREAMSGCIINTASVAGFKGTSTLFAYAASKWAVRGMTKAAAMELARYKIRVNAILPGVIDTPILNENPDRMNEILIKSAPLRRLGSVDEIAAGALYLATAQFVTGTDFIVDGGMSL